MDVPPVPPSAPPPPPPLPGQYSAVPYGAPAASPSASAPRRSKAVFLLGVVLLVVGLAGGAALYLLSGTTREQTIERFARAPVGCTTTLQFDRTGTFTLYIELTGTVSAVGGDCDRSGQSYRWTGSTLPAYALTMVDSDGAAVALADSAAFTYDTGGWRGQAVGQVQVTAPGTFRLTVDSADSGFAVAIGGDPDADASVMQLAGIAAMVVGGVAGVVLIVVGRRRKPPSTGVPALAMPPYASTPVSPVPPLADRPMLPTRPPGAAPPPPPGWGAPRP